VGDVPTLEALPEKTRMNRRNTLTALPALAALVAAAALTWTQPAQAVDSATPAVPATAAPAADTLAAARALIEQSRWRDAIEALKAANQPDSADWHNLMGYSHRKAKMPDFAAAEAHYNAALRINPQHRGALEYSGELYLMMGDLPRAEERLAQLDKACFLGCAELRELRAAVAAYKARPGS
jgi:tetratricopeptide (TPR) repeat protein